MRLYLAAAIWSCACGFLGGLEATAHAAEITDLASSFEKGRPFGFRFGASYQFSHKTARIMRESVPYLQTPTTKSYLYNRLGVPLGQELQTTEVVPDLTYVQTRHAMSIDLAVGLFTDLQLGISLPLVLRDDRSYSLDREAGFNTCADTDYTCIARASSTVLDGIVPVDPLDQANTGLTLLTPPTRGGSGSGMLDTINLSLMGAPVSQRRDPTKPTWVIGAEAQLSIGTIMGYDQTRQYLNANDPTQKALVEKSLAMDPGGKRGFDGVSDGLNKFVFKTALSHRFRYVDPYLGLWYMLPLARTWLTEGSPWTTDYGFAQRRGSPQQQAGLTFGFEATPFENKEKGHRVALDFRAGLQFHFLGRGYSEAWELLSASNALVCDDSYALPGRFGFPPRNGADVTQGEFNPACRTPYDTSGNEPNPAYRPRLPSTALNATAHFQRPYSGVSVIENYLTFNAQLGVVVELFKHLRLRMSGSFQKDQGHGITQDDSGTTTYPNNDRDALNKPLQPSVGQSGCRPGLVDQNCPFDWNPLYRPVINTPGRHYRVEDVNVWGGSAMLQGYW